MTSLDTVNDNKPFASFLSLASASIASSSLPTTPERSFWDPTCSMVATSPPHDATPHPGFRGCDMTRSLCPLAKEQRQPGTGAEASSSLSSSLLRKSVNDNKGSFSVQRSPDLQGDSGSDGKWVSDALRPRGRLTTAWLEHARFRWTIRNLNANVGGGA